MGSSSQPVRHACFVRHRPLAGEAFIYSISLNGSKEIGKLTTLPKMCLTRCSRTKIEPSC